MGEVGVGIQRMVAGTAWERFKSQAVSVQPSDWWGERIKWYEWSWRAPFLSLGERKGAPWGWECH